MIIFFSLGEGLVVSAYESLMKMDHKYADVRIECVKVTVNDLLGLV